MNINDYLDSLHFSPPSVRCPSSYGLLFRNGTKEFKLLQISGGADRIRLEEGQRKWWCKIPTRVEWEIYETTYGQTYPTRDMAEMVVRNLTRS